MASHLDGCAASSLAEPSRVEEIKKETKASSVVVVNTISYFIDVTVSFRRVVETSNSPDAKVVNDKNARISFRKIIKGPKHWEVQMKKFEEHPNKFMKDELVFLSDKAIKKQGPKSLNWIDDLGTKHIVDKAETKHILVLHGLRQSKDRLKFRMRGLDKTLKGCNIELHYLDAPYDYVGPVNEKSDSDRKETLEESLFSKDCTKYGLPKQWWTIKDKQSVFTETAETYDTANQSVLYVEDHIRVALRNGIDYSAILGFSQGGALIQLLSDETLANFKAIVFVGTYVAAFEPEIETRSHPNTLHIAGSSDEIVPVNESLKLAKLYPNAEFHQHNKAHCVPSTTEGKNAIKSFLVKHLF